MKDLTISRNIENVAAAARHETRGRRKITVHGFHIETMGFGKVIHICRKTQIPTIHDNGRVTIRHHGQNLPITADRYTLAREGRADYVTYTFNIQ